MASALDHAVDRRGMRERRVERLARHPPRGGADEALARIAPDARLAAGVGDGPPGGEPVLHAARPRGRPRRSPTARAAAPRLRRAGRRARARARARSPASIASASCDTSKRATSSTASRTCSKASSPGGKSSASFWISWCAASRLPSTQSARNSSALRRALLLAREARADPRGSAARSTGKTLTTTPAAASAPNQAEFCPARSSRGSVTSVSVSSGAARSTRRSPRRRRCPACPRERAARRSAASRRARACGARRELAPVEAALDQVDVALGVALGARLRADRVGGLEREQRLVAVDA